MYLYLYSQAWRTCTYIYNCRVITKQIHNRDNQQSKPKALTEKRGKQKKRKEGEEGIQTPNRERERKRNNKKKQKSVMAKKNPLFFSLKTVN